MANRRTEPVTFGDRAGLVLVYLDPGRDTDSFDASAPEFADFADADMIQGYGGADHIFANNRDNIIFGDQRFDGRFATRDFDPLPDEGDTLFGLGGNDQIYGGAGTDRLFGGGGDDLLDGGPGADDLYGGFGDDVLYGGPGADQLEGQSGDDILIPGNGTGDIVLGGDGTDTLDFRYFRGANPGATIDMSSGTATAGSVASAEFFGIENVWGSTEGRNSISGDDFANEIRTFGYSDSVHGGGGNDRVFTGGGDDWLGGGKGADHLKGEAGNDRLYGNRGSDRLIGGTGDDVLVGGKGNDTLVGSAGDDILKGKGGTDRLKGGDGNDVLDGGSGNDELIGGSGADIFLFARSSGRDEIADFEAGDLIRILSGASRYSQLEFTNTQAGLKIAYSNVEIFLSGLDLGDVGRSNFDFV